MADKKLPTEPYKGVRDFYPQDQFIQKYLFETMARPVELFGYEEYNASVLEPAEMYRTKTSEEIVNEQTYTFTDRGDREVTLRPEMTPTVARMIAAKRRDLALPVRWYSIQNFFRYERPQRGRIREFWQLNADIIGHHGLESDAEVIALAYAILRAFGAEERDFEIRVSDRRLLESAYDACDVDSNERARVTRLLDRREKMDDFASALRELIQDRADTLIDYLDRTTSTAYLEELRTRLATMGVGNVIVDTKITRGFDYYTGVVFEIFDTNEANRRSLFGGGRYDNLLNLFSEESVPAVGFAVGDVTLRDFLETHNLLPAYTPVTELMLCVVDKSAMNHAITLAQSLRQDDVAVSVNFSGKRIGDQIKQAEKLGIPNIIAIGEDERNRGQYTIKNLQTGNQTTISADRIAEHLFSSVG